MNEEQIEEWLAARTCLYQTLALMFGGEPRAEHLEQLTSNESMDALSLFDGGAFRDCLEQQRSVLLSDEGGEALKDEYTRLFLGPGASPAPPWSSKYRLPEEGTLFNGVVLSVRSYYRAQGYECAWHHKVADDHIGIMMDFLAALAQRTWEAQQDGDAEARKQQLVFQGEFLRECMNNWLPQYAASVDRYSRVDFYKALSSFAAVACAADEDAIREFVLTAQ